MKKINLVKRIAIIAFWVGFTIGCTFLNVSAGEMDDWLKRDADSEWIQKAKADLKKYNAKWIISVNRAEADPFKFEGKVVAIPVLFQKMISKTSGLFSGVFGSNPDLPNQIIVSGIPNATHFEPAFPTPEITLLILKGKGVTKGHNAFGATITVPNFQYIATIPDGGKLFQINIKELMD